MYAEPYAVALFSNTLLRQWFIFTICIMLGFVEFLLILSLASDSLLGWRKFYGVKLKLRS